MKKKSILYCCSIGLFFLMACQSKPDTPATPPPAKAPTETPAPKAPRGQDPQSSNFNFETAIANYNQGQHGDLVDYINAAITEVNREVNTLPKGDQILVTKSLDALKILAVKVRRTDFKHPQVLENAIARMEINQGLNYLYLAKKDAKGQADKAIVRLKKSTEKMEHAAVRFKGSLKVEADELIRNNKNILKNAEEKTSDWDTEIAPQIKLLSKWLASNAKDLGIVI